MEIKKELWLTFAACIAAVLVIAGLFVVFGHSYGSISTYFNHKVASVVAVKVSSQPQPPQSFQTTTVPVVTSTVATNSVTTTQPIALVSPAALHAEIPTDTLSAMAATPTEMVANTTLKFTNGPAKPTQYVVLAFDGSYSIDMWQQTRQFAKQMRSQNKPLSFTYFISGVYLLANQKRSIYCPPGLPCGSSAIGFAASPKDVAARVQQINLASSEGHEIASHANGHFNGSHWTYDQWKSELDSFNSLLTNVAKNNGIKEFFQIPPIKGFRAPELGRDADMWKALASEGYTYDTSGVGKPDVWPTKDINGLWLFPLARIKYSTTTFSLLAMDYNFYFKQTGAKDEAVKGSPQWNTLYQDMLLSYENYFKGNYNGARAPVYIGHHFSLWNDGVYWEVMKSFATEVCGQPNVKCVTFSELAHDLDAMKTVKVD